jgi:hypothetical protein
MEDRCVLDSTTVINEVMYHPADNGGPEWIELFNQLAVDMDLSGWTLDDAVSFRFPEGTLIKGGGHLVVAADPTAFQQSTGLTGALGPWTGSLANEGERIELRNNNSRLMSVVEYNDREPWPAAADGSGASMAKVNERTANSEIAAYWQGSASVGGTPGAANIEPVHPMAALRFNEAAGSAAGPFWLELMNTGTTPLNTSGLRLLWSARPSFQLTLPDRVLGPGAIFALTELPQGVSPDDGDRFYLSSADGKTVLDAVQIQASARGRSPDGRGEWHYTDSNTLGAANRFQFRDEIVINEIMYHHRPTQSRPGTPEVVQATTLVGFDSNWRYNSSGADLPVDWFRSVHPAGGDWQTGKGLFGFESDPVPSPGIGTQFTDLGTTATVTFYFETEFDVTDELRRQIIDMELRHVIDDGAVIYLNGMELTRYNMPEGAIHSETTASQGINNATVSAPLSLPVDRLVAGRNRLHVEVHQNTPLSQDVLFGLELVVRAETSPAMPATAFQDDAEEWIELFNRGEHAVDLTGWRLDDAMTYAFVAGTRIEPGQYLVVANDAASLRSKYPTLTNIVGDFGGALANSGERIRLLDAEGNPVDDVSYFEAGRWDSRADGSGPSLELTDVRADNSKGESWLASDEASKSEWHTYTYRGVANRVIPGEPTVWNEFAFGFLDGAGEVLMDDFSVVEDPDGAAVQLIQNGSFDAGTSDHWRLLGNHQRSRIVNDDGNPVLHVISDGATEYQGNQIETTFVNNTRIKNGTVYEISYKAKWLSGSRQINSRLYFNRLAKTTQLLVPELHGTPGQPNSRRRANIGPTYNDLRHAPLVPAPGEPITVSARAADPDQIQTMTLWYNVAERGWLSAVMNQNGDGLYSASIPGQSNATVVQFYVEGHDRLGASSQFPAAGRDSRALIVVDDRPAETGPLHRFRMQMTRSDRELLHRPTNSLSNLRLGSTVIYQGEAFYDTRVRLKGSFVGRNAARVGFNIAFNPDEKFLGVHSKVAIDRSTHADIGGVDELLLKHAASHAGGIPSMYDDVVDFIAPTASHSGKVSLRMAGFDDVYLDSQFENGSEGTEYEFEVIRWSTTTVDGNPESLKRGGGLDDPNGYVNVEFRDLGDDKEYYRWTNLIVSNRTRDDYDSIIALHKAITAADANLEAATNEVMDIDQWMRTAAFQVLFGPADAYYTGGNIHNFRLYARPDGKVLYLPWDWDSSFQNSTSASLVGGGRLARVVNLPRNLRVYYGHMLDILDTTFNAEYMETWTTHYGSLAGRNFNPRLTYIDRRAQFALGRINRDFPKFDFQVNTTGPLKVDDTVATVEGKAWLDVREIRVAGSDVRLPVEWSSSGGRAADTWRITLPVAFGSHNYAFEAIDYQGNVVGRHELVIESTATDRPLVDFLRLSELHYNPAGTDTTEFLEFTNVSSAAQGVVLDLSGVRVEMSPSSMFRFAAGTRLAPGQHVVIVNDPVAFQSAYPQVSSEQIVGDYSGNLDNGGERVRVIDPSGTLLIDLTYGDSDPWPTAADGEGSSLQLVNPAIVPRDHINEPQSWRAMTPSPGRSVSEPLPGDFDASGTVDAMDIDLLFVQLGSANPDVRFDLTGDGAVDDLDRNHLVHRILRTKYGDANLDGVFDSRDLVLIFQKAEFEDPIAGNSTWSEGDWNGDREFSTSDLVLGFQDGYENG